MKNNFKEKKIIFYLVFIGIFILNSFAFALQVDWPKSPAGTGLSENSTLPDLIKYLYEWGISLGGLAVFVALLIAGFQYITSTGDPAKMKNAMDSIKSAGMGLLLLLGSWLILNTINPQFTTFSSLEFNPPDKSKLTPFKECKSNSECNEDYECKDNYCTPKPIASNPCENVTLIINGEEINIKANQDITKTIPTGTNFSSKTNESCYGVLEFYIRVANGKCEGTPTNFNINTEYTTSETYQCIKLNNYKTSSTPTDADQGGPIITP